MHSDNEIKENKLKDLQELFVQGNMDLVIPEAIKLFEQYSSGIAYNILALAYKRQGNYEKSRDLYQKILVQNPQNTMFLTNLGNINFDLGKIHEAEECFKKSLAIDPKQLNAAISLANIYSNRFKYDDALFIFKSLKQDFKNLKSEDVSDINYRIADIYRIKEPPHFDSAIKHYALSNDPLSSAQRLECIYKSKDEITYLEEERKLNASGELNPLLAAIQTHASIRYTKPDENLFCRDPFRYIFHSKLTLSDGFSDDIVSKILKIKDKLDSSPQPLIEHGEQSAGNIFVSNDPIVEKIKSIIQKRVMEYRDHFKGSNEGFIKKWPINTSLHGWIIDLKKGGSLASHMHKKGWLSGSLYLNLPKDPGSSQGNIIFDLDGANYPKNGQVFQPKEFNIEKGDIILFPSSIFHKTVPFEALEHRVTLAFDVKPVFA